MKRAYQQKSVKLSPLFKTAADDMLKAWPGNNIAKRITVNNIKDLKPLLTEYARIYPEHLPYGVLSVLPAKVTDDFFMATNGKGSFWFAEVEHNGFNSRTDLLGGLAAIKAGSLLTEHHEYAIESLWHEICHNRQDGISAVLKLDEYDPRRLLIETINQYVSRMSYGGFIERLGGKAVHQAWVLQNGYGYQESVKRLMEIFNALKIEESLKGDIFNINFNSNLLIAHELLAEAINKKTKIDKNLVIQLLLLTSGPRNKFNELILELNPS